MIQIGNVISVMAFQLFVIIQNVIKRLIEGCLMFVAVNLTGVNMGADYFSVGNIYFSEELKEPDNFVKNVFDMTTNPINQNQILKNGLIGK